VPRTYEIAAENGHRVRVDASSEREAFEKALDRDPTIWMGGAYPADGLPVGWDGGDAEQAVAEGMSLDNGDAT
jgi:hypothetical protein